MREKGQRWNVGMLQREAGMAESSSPKVWVGTSGWMYRHWEHDVFYPPRMRSDEFLPFYAERFPTVELNNSFYRLPPRSSFELWKQRTPEGFLVAVKGSRYLTHIKKLNEPEEPLQRLMEHAGGLGEKLGPILFQFPASWELHRDRLAHVVELLRHYPGQRFTFEFRHSSWLVPEVYELLRSADAALCLPSSSQLPVEVRLTASWSYLRMHGGNHGIGYTDPELDGWAGNIRSFLDQGADVYVYFNNDLEGHAIRDAPRLMARLPPECVVQPLQVAAARAA